MFVIRIRRQYLTQYNPLTGFGNLTDDPAKALCFSEFLDAEEVVDVMFDHPTPRYIRIIPQPQLS